MDITLKRVLTLKSILGFGSKSQRECPIWWHIDNNKQYQLAKIYYGLDKIDFNQEVKDLLGITKDLEIKKPGKLPSKEYKPIINKCMKNIKTEEDITKAIIIGNVKRKSYSKAVISNGYSSSNSKSYNRGVNRNSFNK